LIDKFISSCNFIVLKETQISEYRKNVEVVRRVINKIDRQILDEFEGNLREECKW
jgi:hypothetical protein